MKTHNGKGRPRVKKAAEQVMHEVREAFPDLCVYIEPERDWLWYCGPSLAGPENKPKREALKEIGFRWAKNGHETESGSLGSWGHACLHPIPFKRRGRKGKGEGEGESEDSQDLTPEQILAMM